MYKITRFSVTRHHICGIKILLDTLLYTNVNLNIFKKNFGGFIGSGGRKKQLKMRKTVISSPLTKLTKESSFTRRPDDIRIENISRFLE